uniref:Uncharacterized protein n=1 Tax=Salix viminalis TaxID=40686 RepID=A0A6N2KZX3_SALVM
MPPPPPPPLPTSMDIFNTITPISKRKSAHELKSSFICQQGSLLHVPLVGCFSYLCLAFYVSVAKIREGETKAPKSITIHQKSWHQQITIKMLRSTILK